MWRVTSGAIKIDVFDADAVKIAEQIRLRTPPNALFLNAPTYNTAVALTGRRSLLRYIGHLMSHGINYREREDDLNRIYEGSATARPFLAKIRDRLCVDLARRAISAGLQGKRELF